MGDRANILVKADDKDNGVYLYSHWSGSRLPKILGAALGRRLRWNDTPYLTRIIFDQMVGENQGGEIGFGISSFPGDGMSRVLIVNCEKNSVKEANMDSPSYPHIHHEWTFDEFLESPQEWDKG
jgi:hypothetical protein